MKKKIAVIIGAGPAGITAAYELSHKTDIQPVIFEEAGQVGGICKTVDYKGNRIDIGGHRFYSKSERVTQWWLDILPAQGSPSKDDIRLKRQMTLSSLPGAPDPEKTDAVMLIRQRISRIYFMEKFFNYPISLDPATLLGLGVLESAKIGFSYIRARLFPIKKEKNLEDFFINRFGRELYSIFFKGYTQKVWGTPCNNINARWGAQRIKGISILTVLAHAIRNIFIRKPAPFDQKDLETSLINYYFYPKLGPGQLWEEAAKRIIQKGGQIHTHHRVVGVRHDEKKIVAVEILDLTTGETIVRDVDYLFSSMPVKELIGGMRPDAPPDISAVSGKLSYRDFITVGLLLSNLNIKDLNNVSNFGKTIPDTWIYIPENNVRMGRIQIYNNWSPYLVKDQDRVWVGIEYFCSEGDSLWSRSDAELVSFALEEMVKMGFANTADFIDGTTIRFKKAYPAYCGAYEGFNAVKDYLDTFENLFPIGRNGMHRYNNTDHAMLTAMLSVDAIIDPRSSKKAIWHVNDDQEYQEEKRRP